MAVDYLFCVVHAAVADLNQLQLTSNTLFPGAFSPHTRRITAQAKDVTFALKKIPYHLPTQAINT